MVLLTKLFRNCTAHSKAVCTFPGSRTFSFRVSSSDARIRAAITTQDTTTDSVTGMPPRRGMVNTVGVLSSSSSRSLICSKCYPSRSVPARYAGAQLNSPYYTAASRPGKAF